MVIFNFEVIYMLEVVFIVKNVFIYELALISSNQAYQTMATLPSMQK